MLGLNKQKKPIMKKQIPTILGLLVLVIAIVIGILFFSDGIGVFSPRATPETAPRQIKITNLKDHSFTVTFYTEEETTGFIKYGTDPDRLNSQVADDRDQLSGTVGTYNLHHITLRSLQPENDYYYVLGTGSNAEFDNQGQPFRTTTLSEPSVPAAEAKTVYGSVSNEDGNAAEGSIVYVTADGFGDLSSLVKATGSWAVSLSQARGETGLNYVDLSDSDLINILVQGVPISKTIEHRLPVGRAQPVPELIFGQPVDEIPFVDEKIEEEEEGRSRPQDFDLSSMLEDPESDDIEDSDLQEGDLERDEDEAISGRLQDLLGEAEPLPVESSASAELDLDSEPAAGTATGEEADEVTYTTQSPKIKGRAKPNVEVKIQIHSENQYEEIVMADDDGNFELDLEALGAYLEPGEHTATYTYTDPDTGEEVTASRTFFVEDQNAVRLAQANSSTDSQSSFGTGDPYPMDASPTPTLANQPEPTPSDTDPSDTALTPTPQLTPEPTPEPTPVTSNGTTVPSEATHSTTGARQGHIATDSSPKAGSIEATLLLVLGGIFFIMMGGWSWWLAAELQEE